MNRIAELRKEKHLNQIGLAMKLNISKRIRNRQTSARY